MTWRSWRPAELLPTLQSLWVLILVVLRNLQPVLVLALIGLVGWALLFGQPWPYAIEAEAERVSLKLAGDVETNWRIDGAQLCVRARSESLALPLLQGRSPCPGRRWTAYDTSGLRETSIRLSPVPGVGFGYSARIDAEPDGSLALQLEPLSEEVEASLFAGSPAAVSLVGDVLLRFPAPVEGQSPGRILLPFSGAGTIGQDVAWHDPSLLRGGRVSIFTHSEEAAGGRDQVAEVELLPGDRVDLRQGGSENGAMAKGFVLYDVTSERSAPPSMTVVAFGEADAIRIVRFGDRGYSFSPGPVARLSRHSAVSTWVVLILSLLGFMAVYREGSEIGEGTYQQRRRDVGRRWRKLRGDV